MIPQIAPRTIRDIVAFAPMIELEEHKTNDLDTHALAALEKFVHYPLCPLNSPLQSRLSRLRPLTLRLLSLVAISLPVRSTLKHVWELCLSQAFRRVPNSGLLVTIHSPSETSFVLPCRAQGRLLAIP